MAINLMLFVAVKRMLATRPPLFFTCKNALLIEVDARQPHLLSPYPICTLTMSPGTYTIPYTFFFVQPICFFGMTGDYRQFALKNYCAILVVCSLLFNNGEYIQCSSSPPVVVLFMTFFSENESIIQFSQGLLLICPLSVHFKMEGIYV